MSVAFNKEEKKSSFKNSYCVDLIVFCASDPGAFACVQTSRITKEIGDVCTQATGASEFGDFAMVTYRLACVAGVERGRG